MTVKTLTMGQLAVMDNARIGEAFNLELKRVLADLEDRPLLEKVRTITLTVSLSPVAEDEGPGLEGAVVDFKLKSTMPERQSKPYHMANRDGQLMFNDLAPENARQGTLGHLDGGRKTDAPGAAAAEGGA